MVVFLLYVCSCTKTKGVSLFTTKSKGIRDRRLLLLKMGSCILSGGYFLNAPVYSKIRQKRAFQADRSSPV